MDSEVAYSTSDEDSSDVMTEEFTDEDFGDDDFFEGKYRISDNSINA